MTEKTEALIISTFSLLIVAIGVSVIFYIGYKVLTMP